MDKERIRQSAVLLLEGLGVDLKSDHFKGTPDRWVKMWVEELALGLELDPKQVLNVEFIEKKYQEMIFVDGIDFMSVCPHHLLPWIGQVSIGYVAKGKITGLSKLARLVDVTSKKPQVQEVLTVEIADILFNTLQPMGCGVLVKAKHLCACGRGVKKVNMEMTTTALRGCFLENDSVKQEFLYRVR